MELNIRFSSIVLLYVNPSKPNRLFFLSNQSGRAFNIRSLFSSDTLIVHAGELGLWQGMEVEAPWRHGFQGCRRPAFSLIKASDWQGRALIAPKKFDFDPSVIMQVMCGSQLYSFTLYLFFFSKPPANSTVEKRGYPGHKTSFLFTFFPAVSCVHQKKK